MTITLLNGPTQAIFDAIYPVGSIYTSVNSTNPGTLFGGTWQRITGKFLLAATDNGATGTNVQSNASVAPGASGGEAGHTLASTEMPVHKHTMDSSGGGGATEGPSNNNTGTPSPTSTVGESVHTHNAPANRNWISYNYGSGSGTITTGVGTVRVAAANSGTNYVPRVANASVDFSRSSATAAGANHSHGLNSHTHNLNSHTHKIQNHTHTMQNAGGSNGTTQAHNNMPPFLAVYVWKRTA